MRAISQNTYGGPEVLTETELPLPEPGVGEIRVRVAAAGVNPTDWKHRDGTIPYDHGLPATTGWDVAGVVDKAGPGVTIFDEGDAVFGMLPYPYEPGGYAEYTTGPPGPSRPSPTASTSHRPRRCPWPRSRPGRP